MDHKDIIESLRSGDNRALRSFYQDHHHYCIQRLISEHRCSHEDAEDIFIEALMELREKLIAGKVEEIRRPQAYLYRTCYNMFLARLETRKRLQKNQSDIERFYYGSREQFGEATAQEPFDPRLLEITRKAWRQLSEKCQDILNFFYVERLGMKKIAELMGLANSDVAKSTKSRCYQKFVALATDLQDRPSEKPRDSVEGRETSG